MVGVGVLGFWGFGRSSVWKQLLFAWGQEGRGFYESYETELGNLDLMTKWELDDEIIKKFAEQIHPDCHDVMDYIENERILKDFKVSLNMSYNDRVTFVSKVKELTMSNLDALDITRVDRLLENDSDVDNMNIFLLNFVHRSLPEFTFSSSPGNYLKFSNFKPSLINIFAKITTNLTLKYIRFENEELKTFIESCRHISTIKLVRWIPNISSNFILDPSLHYSITKIDLLEMLTEPDFLTPVFTTHTLPYFLNALGKTDIVSSLTEITISKIYKKAKVNRSEICQEIGEKLTIEN